jgi:hypothetical protein
MSEEMDDLVRRLQEAIDWLERRRAAAGGRDLLRKMKKLHGEIDVSRRTKSSLTKSQKEKLLTAMGRFAVYLFKR